MNRAAVWTAKHPGRAWLILLAALGVLYVGLAWTPSHVAFALRMLGFDDTGLVVGRPQQDRSDDFMVATPLIRLAVANHFGPVDEISPYREELRSFVAAPFADWSLIFKPQFWGFWLLPPAYALSLYFFLFYAAFMIGYTLLGRRLGLSLGWGLALAATLILSQLPQVWWTQRAPLYAFAPWPLLAFLWRAPWTARLPAIAYATAVWLFGELYPPAIIGTVFAWVIAVAAFQSKEISPPAWLNRLLPALVAGALGAGLVWFYFADLIPVMAATVYPGQRQSSGGGIPVVMLLAHLFPHFATLLYHPIIPDSNPCEIGVVGTYLPLFLLVFADPASLKRLWASERPALLVWLGGLALMLAWLTLPVPAAIGRVLLWDRVPPNRLLWGFGLLLTLGMTVVAAKARWQLTWPRFALFTITILASWALSKFVLLDPASGLRDPLFKQAVQRGLGDLVVLPPLAIANYLARRSDAARAGLALICVGALALGLTFGRFNPIQSAQAVFQPATQSRLLTAADELARANPRGWAAVPGIWGGLLNAFGIPAINQVLFRPDLPFFRRLYPDMPEPEFQQIFNRYAHIDIGYRAAPVATTLDAIELPVFDVGTPLSISVDTVSVTSTGGAVERVEVTALGSGRWRLVAVGWAPFINLTDSQRLTLTMPAGSVRQIRAVRLPRPDIGRRMNDSKYDTAGFAFEAVIDAADEAAVRTFAVSAWAGDGTGWRLTSLADELPPRTN